MKCKSCGNKLHNKFILKINERALCTDCVNESVDRAENITKFSIENIKWDSLDMEERDYLNMILSTLDAVNLEMFDGSRL